MPEASQVVPLPLQRIELGMPPDCAVRIAAELRDHVPAVAAEAAGRIEEALPEFLRPQDPRYAGALRIGTEQAIRHFLDLMADPAAGSSEVLRFWRQVGAGEAAEGRSLDAWQAAVRIGAGVAVERLTERAERLGHNASAATVAVIVNAVFGYINQLAAAVGEGHAEVRTRSADTRSDYRRRLVDQLLGRGAADAKALAETARAAGWPLPRTALAVALKERGAGAHPPAPAPDVLLGLHLPEPCLIVPDPDGPGRERALERQLQGWTAVIGPVVEPAGLARSLRIARQALALAEEGLIDASRPVVAERHMPIIVMMQERDLVEGVIKRRLAPLLDIRPAQRYRLAETLLVSLECGFNATEVAGRLHLHAQTVRYRLRQLGDLFGDDLHATGDRLELHMALHAWLTANAAEAPPAAQLRTG
ncbi:PucR family transcriptional regulator [Actinomadura parmotrematis]|uniref:Helix-turn-helix domain-containing protein n=1 Tax=Actinomadura parmotrematis TaxID=2864039 RepID=A0ABS7FUT7_9ACTN|nr:helix-turn-helix domain-containing protein [Actinomadura parmotrematis]MBW8483955.1 helix-turn-helix domain-containing protein [Actinomadura parmotrematis]